MSEIVKISTRHGDISIKLFTDLAPKHCESFLKLARDGFYDNTLFHRVIPNFMIQGGDPNSKNLDNRAAHGSGGPGYSIAAEFSDTKHVRGIVSAARSQDPDSAGSQFFIVVADSSFLDNEYTVFGEVSEGIEIADKIVSEKRDSNDNPHEAVPMKVQVIET